MPNLTKRRKAPDPQLVDRVRSEMRRILAVLDDAAVSGNLSRLGQAFAGDALAEVKARFTAYQAAGIQVSPFRESLHLEISEMGGKGQVVARLRYRDRTSFLTTEASPSTTNEPVQLRVVLDGQREPWRVTSIAEE
ncbi:MAG TPA: hypothetical protein VMV12_07965 [Candidatus Micrarchaeaceae archaeon]|nr:hypothetical protein [Candidatus Micrarchaeaceae archaeon]